MWTTLKDSLKKTSQKLTHALKGLFGKESLSAEERDTITDSLILADLSGPLVEEILTTFERAKGSQQGRYEQLVTHFIQRLEVYERVLLPPKCFLALGVNGAGKTTLLGKLGHLWHGQGHDVQFVAADTFRAAAVEQLAIWAGNHPVVRGDKDPASVVYKALSQGQNRISIIDTAGRLPNKTNLMMELKKIDGVIQKLCPEGRETILVLDATVGHHGAAQVKAFSEILPLTGLIMNKMDGSSKGGALMDLALTYKIPICGMGVGEGLEDYIPFLAKDFVHQIFDPMNA